MEAKKKSSWELLAQIALSKSKTKELFHFLREQTPPEARKLRKWREQLSRTLPPEESLSQTVVEMRDERV